MVANSADYSDCAAGGLRAWGDSTASKRDLSLQRRKAPALVPKRSLIAVVGVASAALGVSVVIPALRNSKAQDAASGGSQPAFVVFPDFAPAPTPANPRLAQLPAVEESTPVPASPATPLPQAPATWPPQGPAPAGPTTGQAAAAPQGAGQPVVEQRFQLRTLTADQLHARIEQIFGHPAPILAADGSAWTRFTVQTGGDAPVMIAVLPQTGEVRILGRPDQLRAWRDILTAVDAPTAADRATEVVAADEKSAPQIRKTVDMLLAQAQVPAGEGTIPGAMPGIPQGLLGPVEIVNIPGTDLFIIQGNPRDVARAMEVVRQIQEMSRVSEPQIVVRQLANVDSQAISTLLTQLFTPATEGGPFTLGGYYGRLLAAPLGRPNAVLLVGSPGTVGKAEEILNELDKPAQAATQFQVFPLKFAKADAAKTVVEQLFTIAETTETTTAPTFGPKALVIAEPRTNSLIVRASPSDMAEVRALIEQVDKPGGEAVNELRVFKLRHSLASVLGPVLQRAVRGEAGGAQATATTGAQSLATLLRMVTIDAEGRQQLESGVLAGVIVNADTRANALVVSAPPESMPLMGLLIAQLDQPPDAVAELKVFKIINGDAVSLAEMLQSLFGTPQAGGGGGGGGGGPGGGGGGAGQAANTDVFQLRFSVDERTNSIIAAGSPDELIAVQAILMRLDAGESRSRVNRVYRLKNASSLDVAVALQDWLQRKREVEQTAPGATSPFSQIEREIVVVAEPASNSLIVSATPTYYQELEGIIQQLDEQAPMVMIQVLIGEVRLGDADEFGVELGLQDSVLFDRSLLESEDFLTTTNNTTIQNGGNSNTFQQQIIRSARQTPGFDFGDPATGLGNSASDRSLVSAASVGAQGLSSFAVNRVSPDLGFGGFVLSASSNSVSMLLRALQESRRLEVLSRPQIMALDNQEGRAFVGQLVPIIVNTQFNQLTGTPILTTQQQPVGLELLVRPRISPEPENLVVMTVSAIKRELAPLDTGIPIATDNNGDPVRAPIINSTEAQTTVSAVPGQTVVLSGLLTKRDEALNRRVPLLADIPLVGSLFRFDSSRQVRTELLIILTPHVVRSRAESERIKQVESARMSWCLSDVVDLHGAVGLRSRTDMIGAAEAEVVYPDAMSAAEPQLAPADQGDLNAPAVAPPQRYDYPVEPPTPMMAPEPTLAPPPAPTISPYGQ